MKKGKNLGVLIERLLEFNNYRIDNDGNPVYDLEVLYQITDYLADNTILGTVIDKTAKYALKDFMIEGSDVQAKEEGLRVDRKLKIREGLEQQIIYAFKYGYAPFYEMNIKRKYLKCPVCGTEYNLSSLASPGEKPPYNYNNGKWQFACRNKNCNSHGINNEFKLIERPVGGLKGKKVVLWNPRYIMTLHNPVTEDTVYAYRPPSIINQGINRKDPFILSTTPSEVLRAAESRKAILLTENKFGITSMYTRKQDGVPIPIITRSFVDMYLAMTLQRANFSITSEYMVPLRALFPIKRGVSGGPMGGDAFQDKFNSIAKKVNDEFKKQKSDPSYIPVFPMEVGSKDYWGNGRLLASFSEVDSLVTAALATAGFPIEMVRGGVTWSRQNTSVITLEAMLKSSVGMLDEVKEVYERQINSSLPGNKYVSILIPPPRLADVMGLVSALDAARTRGDISRTTYIREAFNLDSKTEDVIIERERSLENERISNLSLANAEAQVKGQSVVDDYADERKNIERIQTLKDGIAQGKLEQDSISRNLSAQARSSVTDYKLSQMGMKEQEKASVRDALFQSNLQNEMGKKQMIAQLTIPDKIKQQQAEKEEQEQRQAAIENGKKGLSPEQLKTLESYPKEKAESLLLERNHYQQMIDFFDSLPKSEKERISSLPKEKQEEALTSMMSDNDVPLDQELAKRDMAVKEHKLELENKKIEADVEKHKMTLMNQRKTDDGKLSIENKKVEVDARNEARNSISKDKTNAEDIMSLAKTMNSTSGDELEKLKGELINESTVLYSKVKETALKLAIQEARNMIEAGNVNEAVEIFSSKFPNHVGELVGEIYQDRLSASQAPIYAKYLLDNQGTPKATEIERKLAETPERFRKLVNGYKKIFMESNLAKVNVPKNIHFDEKGMLDDVQNWISLLPPKEQKEAIESLKQENPKLYKGIHITDRDNEEQE